MNAPPSDGLPYLVAACRRASDRYQDAAAVVGDPGLRLQFKHLAAARGDMAAALGVAAGVSAVYGAPLGDEAPRPAPYRTTGARVPLGGEDHRPSLDQETLCALVRALREHDETMLRDACRLRGQVSAEVSAALDRAAETLVADLEKMRILENLTEDLAQPVRSR